MLAAAAFNHRNLEDAGKENMGREQLGRVLSLSPADRVTVNAFVDSPTVTGTAAPRSNLRSGMSLLGGSGTRSVVPSGRGRHSEIY